MATPSVSLTHSLPPTYAQVIIATTVTPNGETVRLTTCVAAAILPAIRFWKGTLGKVQYSTVYYLSDCCLRQFHLFIRQTLWTGLVGSSYCDAMNVVGF